MYLRTICFDAEHPAPGMEPSPRSRISETTFEHFYGAKYGALLDFVYNGSLAAKPNPHRSRNRIQRPAYHPPPEQPIPILFNLSIGDQLVPQQDWDYNPLAEEMDVDDPPRERPTWNARLSQIYVQCIMDMVASVPNPSQATEPSYCILSKQERQEATEAIFNDSNIGKFFNQARWKVGTHKDHQIAFDNLFLEKGKVKTRQQNFGSSPYYKMWNHFRETNTKEVTEEARKALRKRFRKKTVWLPWIQSDRIWRTTRDVKGNYSATPGLSPQTPAPLLLTIVNLRWNPKPRHDDSNDDVSSVASAGMESD
ncbi:hypothetical protein MD484_g9078, partial [Candolleomyces efflorescens]